VHLDIKPGNFIFMADATMKLHDFNLARFLEANVATRDLCDMKRLDYNIVRAQKRSYQLLLWVWLISFHVHSFVFPLPHPPTDKYRSPEECTGSTA